LGFTSAFISHGACKVFTSAKQIEQLSKDIQNCCRKQYDPRKVYIVFNKEEDKRQCLKTMAAGKLEVWSNTTTNPNAILAGHVVELSEPVEPSELLWENFHVLKKERLIRYAITTGLCAFCLYISFLILSSLYGASGAVAVFLAIVNIALPIIIKLLTTKLELHKVKLKPTLKLQVCIVTVRVIKCRTSRTCKSLSCSSL
jgi:hypothetical protein